MSKLYKIEGYISDVSSSFLTTDDMMSELENTLENSFEDANVYLKPTAQLEVNYKEEFGEEDNYPWNTIDSDIAYSELEKYFQLNRSDYDKAINAKIKDPRTLEIQTTMNTNTTDSLSGISPQDPQRIDTILNLIGNIWKENPELRLGQMLETIKPINHADLHSMDDNVLAERLNKFYIKGESFDG